MDDWYCRISGETSGPFSTEELRFLWDRRKLTAADDIRTGDRGQWQTVEEFPNLFPNQTVNTARELPQVVPLSRQDSGEPEVNHIEDTSAVDHEPPVENQTVTPPIRKSVDEDERWRRAAIGSAIGAGVVILVLLLLLLFVPSLFREGAGGGQAAGGGSGTATGEGAGLSDGSETVDVSTDDMSEDTGEITEEDVTEEAAALTATDEDNSGQSRTAGNENAPRPPPPKFTLGKLNEPPAPTQTSSGQASAVSSGSLSELNERLDREGAGSGDVQVSLIWYNINDLDLHIVCPSGERIYYRHSNSACGGELDVDMNAGGQISNKPVENAFWPAQAAPRGKYQVFVHHYASNGARDPSRFEVVVKNGRSTKKFSGSVRRGDAMKRIYEFER